MKPELINVIVAGFPLPLASQVARACRNRQFTIARFGLAAKDFKDDSMEIPEVGKLRMISLKDMNAAKSQLMAEVEQTKSEDRFPVVADVSNDPQNVELYNECNVPFVLRTLNQETRAKSKQLSVISDEFNKHLVAFDSIMREYGKRFPGLFRGFELESGGTSASRLLVQSLNDLFDADLSSAVKRNNNNEREMLEGHAAQEFSFKDGSGSTAFSFRRETKPEEFAEGMADAIHFLARQGQQSIEPKVFSMLDVARREVLI